MSDQLTAPHRTAPAPIALYLVLGIAVLGIIYAATTNWSQSRVMTGKLVVWCRSGGYQPEGFRASRIAELDAMRTRIASNRDALEAHAFATDRAWSFPLSMR